MSLLEGDSVNDAFEKAQAISKSSDASLLKVCCCAHNHKPTCKWFKYAK